MSSSQVPSPAALPEELRGRHEARRVHLPVGVLVALVVVVAVAVVLQLVAQRWFNAALSFGLGAAALMTWLNLSRQPAAATFIDQDGVRVAVPRRSEAAAGWARVGGLRTFTRAVEPQLLLSDGKALGMPGVTSEQARALAGWLAQSQGRQIDFEVDGRRAPL